MADTLSDEEALAIARSNFVEERISIARQLAVNIRKEETRKWIEDKAIRKLQDMARCRIQYKRLRKLIDLVYIKRVDPYTGQMYYYNTQTRVAKWTKPLCLGSKDLQVDQVCVGRDDRSLVLCLLKVQYIPPNISHYSGLRWPSQMATRFSTSRQFGRTKRKKASPKAFASA